MARSLTDIDLYEEAAIRLYGVWLYIVVKLARIKKKHVVFLLGFPRHVNLGDQAIMMAEIKFIKDKVGAAAISVPISMVLQDRKDILSKLVEPSDVITGMGGGNFGDVYIFEELCRRKFIEQFPNNRIVIFPQTIHFTETKVGHSELEKSQKMYGKHKDLRLIARERVSYDKMRMDFPKNNVILAPDIVLSSNRSRRQTKRNGLLLCIRNDLEGNLKIEDKKAIKEFEERFFDKAKYTDTLAKNKFFRYLPTRVFLWLKLREFKSSKLVITDRLHGMIFAAITGTPCIALSNYNHKVSNTYNWIKYLPYIKFCDNTSNLENLFNQINVSNSFHYDPAHFDKYWKMIQDSLTTT